MQQRVLVSTKEANTLQQLYGYTIRQAITGTKHAGHFMPRYLFYHILILFYVWLLCLKVLHLLMRLAVGKSSHSSSNMAEAGTG